MTETGIKVSIVIPVYNAEEFLPQCLDSAVNQTLRDIEIICVNDGSRDGSLEILRRYAAGDSRIVVIDKENEGQAKARNLALSVARGKYAAFVDSDDCADLELCRRLYDCAEETAADLVLYDFVKCADPRSLPQRAPEPSQLAAILPAERNRLLAQMGVVWTKFVRLSWLTGSGIRFPEGYIYEDIIVHWQMLTLARNLAILPERLYFHRVNPAATTFRTDWKRADSIFVYDMLQEFLLERGLYREHRDFFLLKRLGNFASVLDTVDPRHRGRARELILERLGEQELKFLAHRNALRRPDRDLLLSLKGNLPAALRRRAWLVARSCVRFARRTLKRGHYAQ